MRKLFSIAALSFLMVGEMFADQLTPAQALQRLMGDNAEMTVASKARRAQSANKLQLVYTSQLEGINTYYVYNNKQEGGYVLLAADDCMPTVLGVVDKGEFVYENLPENMKWYLEILDSSIKSKSVRNVVAKTISGNAVAPLLGAIEWDQMKPFNLEVPSHNGEQAPVGCVATATAQIMRYHQYPAQGTGSRTYKFWFDTKAGTDTAPTDSTEFSTDFSAHTYDWANMLDKYTNDPVNWNEAQGKAVSVLLKDVGVASAMKYGTTASGGSGTQTYEAMRGLVDYFGYDASMQFISHSYFTDEEWDKIIYGELAGNRPVMFGGNGKDGSGGHEYVCDGFKDGKFHINWGWSGSNNGYFLLTGPGLIPEGTGSGGAEAGSSYGYSLEAAIGIKPSEGGAVEPNMCTTGYTAKLDVNKLSLHGNFVNMCYLARTDTVGVQLQSADGSCYTFSDAACEVTPTSPYNSIDVTIEDGLADGEYTVVPVYKSAGEEAWRMVWVLSTFKAATIKVEGGNLSVTNNDAPKVEAEGEVTTNKKSFRPTKKNEDGTLDAETLVLTCEKGIKNCDEKGQKLSFGCEFYDLTESTDEVDVYWLSNYSKTNAEELAPGACVTTISVDILPELEAGHSYEVNPIFYVGVDESLDDEAYWNALDAQAQYVNLGSNKAPVIDIEEDVTDAIAKPAIITADSKIYDINGRIVRAKNINELATGVYIVKDNRGVRKIVKK